MRDTVLLTGGTGFIGRNILPMLENRYVVMAPNRRELDLSDKTAVDSYLKRVDVDCLVHCAIVNPNKAEDRDKSVYEDTVRAFERLMQYPFKRVVLIGSGAEYDKSRNIVEVNESAIGEVSPADEYGRAKFELTRMARASQNIYNLRIFGCYGPGEPERRFLRHAITCCLKGEELTIRRDCRFSYVHVADLGRAMLRILDGEPRYHDYNICGGRPYRLSELAELVKDLTGSEVPVRILAEGMANEYTGLDVRFTSEFPDFKWTSIEDGVRDEIKWMKESFK